LSEWPEFENIFAIFSPGTALLDHLDTLMDLLDKTLHLEAEGRVRDRRLHPPELDRQSHAHQTQTGWL